MVFATDGIVTRVTDHGASDKIINIITPEYGRIGVFVKGGRSPGGKTTAISQLFTYGNFEIYKKNSAYWLRGGEVINPFYDLSIEIAGLALATYLCDLANELTDEGDTDENREILRLLLNSLYLIGRRKKDKAIIKSVFELRVAAISGYCPEVSYCAYCKEQNPDLMYLDIMGGKLICTDCMAKRGAKVPRISKEFDDMPETSIICGLSPSAVAAMRYIVYSPSNKIFSFEIKDSGELDDLVRAVETYTLNHLGRGFDSLDFYKKVK
jgi:DNA repair protein RecO (recombination protein O)